MLTPSRFEQTYMHVPTTPATPYAGTLTALAIDYDATDDSVVTRVSSPFNLACCGGSLLVTPGLYLLCAILDLITLNFKLAILYWVALFICVILCIFCRRCSSITLLSQVLFGLFVYLYWWNCIGIWHRPHYHTAPAWPWTPRL
jgi:hypothetical protein